MIRGKTLFITIYSVLFLIVLSCHKEDNLSSHVVYGDPAEPIVLNLRQIDPKIETKNVTLEGNQFGQVRFVENRYIIYEPGPGFTFDQVEVISEGIIITNVTFLSRDQNPDCNPFARSYKIQTKKNESIDQTVFFDFCELPASHAMSIFDTPINGSSGLNLSIYSGFASLTFMPSLDYSGQQEFIYEVALYKHSTFEEPEALLSALVQINVTE